MNTLGKICQVCGKLKTLENTHVITNLKRGPESKQLSAYCKDCEAIRRMVKDALRADSIKEEEKKPTPAQPKQTKAFKCLACGVKKTVANTYQFTSRYGRKNFSSYCKECDYKRRRFYEKRARHAAKGVPGQEEVSIG